MAAWINGDEVVYGGETVELYGATFFVTHRVSDGKELLTRRAPDGSNPALAEKIAAWNAEQDDFRRLHAAENAA